MYMIIVGAGEIGSSLIDIATRGPNNIVVIEADPDRATRISQEYDVTVLSTDATSADILKEAGADRADAIVATTSNDATNLMIISLGEELGIPSLVSVVNNKTHTDLFRKLGANVMENPEELVAEYLYNAVKRPKIKDFMTLSGGARVFKVTISEGSSMADKNLKEAVQEGALPDSTLVIAIERGGDVIVPSGETVIKGGDALTIFSEKWTSDELVEKITG